MTHHQTIIWNGIEVLLNYGTRSEPPITLQITPQAIKQLSDTDIVELCRWFREHSENLAIIEHAVHLSYLPYHPSNARDLANKSSELANVAVTTTDKIIQEYSLQVLNMLLEVKKDFPNRKQGKDTPTASGYVYIIKGDDYYKIGRTKNLDRRIKQLSTLPPFDLQVVCIIETDDMYDLELRLHHKFADKRVNGEWFTLEEDDINWIKKLAMERLDDHN